MLGYSSDEEEEVIRGDGSKYPYGDELSWHDDYWYPDVALPSSGLFPKKALCDFTRAEREKIEAACRREGKESPWGYQARIQKAKFNGRETPAEYRARKAAEPEKKAAKAEAAEIPKPKKLAHKKVLGLQQQRAEAGLTQKEAARRIKVKVSVLKDWEAGKKAPGPMMSKIKRVYAAARGKKG